MIPTHITNLLYQFAWAQDPPLATKDLSFLFDDQYPQRLRKTSDDPIANDVLYNSPMNTEFFKRTAPKLSVLIKARFGEIRWMPVLDPIFPYLGYIIDAKWVPESIIISLGFKRVHLLYTEVTKERLESLFKNDICCICLEDMEDRALLHKTKVCAQCSCLICDTCLKKRYEMTKQSIQENEEMLGCRHQIWNFIAQHNRCPNCNYITDLDVVKKYMFVGKDLNWNKERMIEETVEYMR